ncbi:MAG: glutamate formimidoyltransferase [Candidatus Promineifilaceae bacterium]
MQRIVECVPNFSEGSKPEVYNAIVDSIRAVPGCYVLDVSSDKDHNRTVITFVGEPDAVEEGAYQAIAEAARLINLDEHVGEHPRIGATDVCPLIPVKGVTIEDCIALANRLGKRVGDDLGVAVYLYGEAASAPERRSLSNIRRGEYEKWREEVETSTDRKPDFGPAIPKTWGATVIGVRPFLIAYNIFLNTDDVSAAKKIAKAVRFSSGGLRHVQAMGFLVDGRAQVSMNLTDFSKTPIHRIQELVRQEASRFGLSITNTELIGLAPQDALLDAAQWYLQLDEFDEDQVLEVRIARETEVDITPHAFLEATADGSPTPGGGSTAALAGALGAALTQMVANLSVGRKKYADIEPEALNIVRRANTLRNELTRAVKADSEAFEAVMKAYRDKSPDEKARDDAIEKATVVAGEVPLSVARWSLEVASLAREISRIGNINALTDAVAGGIMARAAVQIASLNVRVNATSLENRELASRWLEELETIEKSIDAISEDIMAIADGRGGF